MLLVTGVSFGAVSYFVYADNLEFSSGSWVRAAVPMVHHEFYLLFLAISHFGFAAGLIPTENFL